MKKLFAILLAVAMVASLSVSAFAATDLTGSSASGKDAGDYTIGVTGAYAAGANAKEVISADISWDAMDFTYDMGKGEYSVTDHKMTYPNAAWSTDKAGITVTNHSNTDLTAAFSFAQADGVTITGSFYDSNTATDATTTPNFTLSSAEGTTTSNTPKNTIYFGVSGDPITENKALGTITVSLAGPVWTTVDSEESLKNALEAGGYIKLGADIELTDYIDCSSATATLDLNGHTISQSANEDGVLFVHENYTLTVQDTAGGGKIAAANYTIGVLGTLYVKGGTIVSSSYYAVYMNGYAKTTISGGVLFAQDSDGYGVNAANNSELTITGGTITGGTAVEVMSGGKTTITGGTLTGSIKALNYSNTGGGSLTITGGTFNGDGGPYATAAGINASDASILGGTFNGSVVTINTLTISGGTITSFVSNGTGTLTITDGTVTGDIKNYAGGAVTISGGTVTGKIDNDDPGTVTVTGGTFANDPTDYVPTSGYEVTKNTDSTYTVYPWQDASNAEDLLSAIARGGYIRLSGGITLSEKLTILAGKAVVLDLAGNTVSGNVVVSKGASLTVQDGSEGKTGTITNDDDDSTIEAQGTLTVNGGTIANTNSEGSNAYAIGNSYGTVTVTGGTVKTAKAETIYSAGGTVTISGGSFTSDGNDENIFGNNYTLTISGGTFDKGVAVNTSDSRLTISGGSFTGGRILAGAKSTVSITAGTFSNCTITAESRGSLTIENGSFENCQFTTVYGALKSAKIKINGGTFTGAIGFTKVENTTIEITGGTFSVDPTSYVDTDAYTVTTNDDGTYTVTKNDN